MPALTLLLDRVGIAGGAERYWRIVAPALRDAGFDVRILARVVDDTSRYGGLPVTEVDWAGDDGSSSPDAAARVRDVLAEAGDGVAVTASVFDPAVLDAVRAGAPRWIARIHDHRAFCPNGDRVYPQFPAICTRPIGTACTINTLVHGCMHGPRPASFELLAHRVAVRDRLARADAVLVSSAYMRASALINGLAPQRVIVTPPPLSDDAYAADCAPRPDRDTVLFCGRLTPQKGVHSLIRALAHIPPQRRPLAIVAGRGETEASARTLAERLGVEVSWRGWMRTHALRRAIDEATIVAVPSLEAEPFGLVGTEAQARGRPAVAYDVGGISEWLHGAGFVVRRGDERALAGAVEAALEPATWVRLSCAAYRTSERYRLDVHIARLLPILLEQRSSSAAIEAAPA